MTSDNERDETPIGWRDPTPVPRRHFLVWAALAGIAAACRDAITDPAGTYDKLSSRTVKSSPLRDAKFADYPMASYIPPGYKLINEQDDRPDGFHSARPEVWPHASLEMGSVYKGPRSAATIIPSGMRYPLLIFATKELDGVFMGTETIKGAQIPLTLTDGTSTTALYFDGMWEPTRAFDSKGARIPPKTLKLQWSRLNYHALVYQWRAFHIGIRGSRLSRVEFDELMKTASSMAFPT